MASSLIALAVVFLITGVIAEQALLIAAGLLLAGSIGVRRQGGNDQ